jgi:hypothetical protein
MRAIPVTCSLVVYLLAGIAGGQERVAFTDIEQAGADYSFQGEYQGVVRFGGRPVKSKAGLQVIALGNGKFRGNLLAGGLAGAGWDNATQIELNGVRSREQLTLSGDIFTVLIEAGVANVTSTHSHSKSWGRLKRVVRQSVTMGMPAPKEADVLFAGEATEQLVDARITDEGLLMEGVLTRPVVTDFRLHLEFRTPFMPNSVGQARGNSGVYIQQRYEVQVLDSFGLAGVHNECGGIYRQRPPQMNMALPPLVWQTYDIYFRAARFSDTDKKTENARITIYHNGVAIHSNYELTSKTGAGKPEGPQAMPILLQNHSDPVRFRNFWLYHLPTQ